MVGRSFICGFRAVWRGNLADSLTDRANLGIEKLRFFIRIARDLRFLDFRRYQHAVHRLDDTGRRIGAWRKVHQSQSVVTYRDEWFRKIREMQKITKG